MLRNFRPCFPPWDNLAPDNQQWSRRRELELVTVMSDPPYPVTVTTRGVLHLVVAKKTAIGYSRSFATIIVGRGDSTTKLTHRIHVLVHLSVTFTPNNGTPCMVSFPYHSHGSYGSQMSLGMGLAWEWYGTLPHAERGPIIAGIPEGKCPRREGVRFCQGLHDRNLCEKGRRFHLYHSFSHLGSWIFKWWLKPVHPENCGAVYFWHPHVDLRIVLNPCWRGGLWNHFSGIHLPCNAKYPILRVWQHLTRYIFQHTIAWKIGHNISFPGRPKIPIEPTQSEASFFGVAGTVMHAGEQGWVYNF